VKDSLLGDLKGASGDMWYGLVGKTYMDVVRCCLKGDFGVMSGKATRQQRFLVRCFSRKCFASLKHARLDLIRSPAVEKSNP
jgi:hypothetical protein